MLISAAGTAWGAGAGAVRGFDVTVSAGNLEAVTEDGGSAFEVAGAAADLDLGAVTWGEVEAAGAVFARTAEGTGRAVAAATGGGDLPVNAGALAGAGLAGAGLVDADLVAAGIGLVAAGTGLVDGRAGLVDVGARFVTVVALGAGVFAATAFGATGFAAALMGAAFAGSALAAGLLRAGLAAVTLTVVALPDALGDVAARLPPRAAVVVSEAFMPALAMPLRNTSPGRGTAGQSRQQRGPCQTRVWFRINGRTPSRNGNPSDRALRRCAAP